MAEGSDESESGVMKRIESSVGDNCSPSNVINHGKNPEFTVCNISGRRPVGMPPSHPHSQFGGGGGGVNSSVRPSHNRSRSQPSFLSFDQLPPLSPNNMFRVLPTSLDRVLNEGATNNVQGLALPPRIEGHRRSSSDNVPLGLGEKPVQLVMKREGVGLVDDLFAAYMNFDGMDVFNSSSVDEKASRASGTRTNESSENEGESSGVSSHSFEMRKRGKRSAPSDVIDPAGRHSRSLSIDSFMGNLNLDDPSFGARDSLLSPNNSMDGSRSLFSFELGSGQFSPEELEKIMANERLAGAAKVDPKRVKRILANRVSAARSKERKVRYIAELEYKVQTFQTQATSLSAQLTFLQRDSAALAAQNNELRIRLQALEQQAQIKEALNEALAAEVQRLKIAAQMSGLRLPPQVMHNNPAFQTQLPRNINQSQQTQNHMRPTQNEQSQNRQSEESRNRRD